MRHQLDPWVRKIPWRWGKTTHSSILAWGIPWTEEPSGLQSIGLQRVRHNWSNLARTYIHTFSPNSVHWEDLGIVIPQSTDLWLLNTNSPLKRTIAPWENGCLTPLGYLEMVKDAVPVYEAGMDTHNDIWWSYGHHCYYWKISSTSSCSWHGRIVWSGLFCSQICVRRLFFFVTTTITIMIASESNIVMITSESKYWLC